MLTKAVIVVALTVLAACTAPAPGLPTGSPPSSGTPVASPTSPLDASPSSIATPAEPAALSPARSPVASPSARAGDDGAWRYLGEFPADGAIEVAGVTSHGQGFVAVGFEPYPGEGFGGRRNGVVWQSGDGVTWTRTTPEALASASLRSVLSVSGQLFAFGEHSVCPEFSEDEECADAPDAGVAVWRSPDGMNWQRLAVPDSLRRGIFDGALTDGQQLIVHGSTGEELVGAIWLSPNGESWSEVRELAGVDPINAMEAGGGRLVAFGQRYLLEEDDVETLAAWSEGAGFAQAALPGGQRGVIQDVAWSEVGFVAVGIEQEPSAEAQAPVVLHSPDGVFWTAAPAEQLPADSGLHGVLAIADGYLALGVVPADEPRREQPHSWFSSDGRAWREHAPLAGGAYRQLSSFAAGAAGVVVFATDFEPSDELEPDDQDLGTVHAWFASSADLP